MRKKDLKVLFRFLPLLLYEILRYFSVAITRPAGREYLKIQEYPVLENPATLSIRFNLYNGI